MTQVGQTDAHGWTRTRGRDGLPPLAERDGTQWSVCVLVTGGGRNMEMARVAVFRDGGEAIWFPDGATNHVMHYVTHWRYLPEGPSR